MALLDGRKLAKSIRKQMKKDVAEFVELHGRPPKLDVVLVGENAASEIYVSYKGKDCAKVGVGFTDHRLAGDTGPSELNELVRGLSAADDVDGIIVQLPLPDHLSPDAAIAAIDPAKDVDGFHPDNLGKLVSDKPGLVPCTPLGCMMLLDEAGVDLKGKNAVVVGRSTIVGKPMALMLLARHATVTICHSRTEKLAHIVAEADVVVAAVGRPGVIDGDWIKSGAAVIDVGINRLKDGTLVGDVDFNNTTSRASWVTPVPGGVGPMTRACLITNTVAAAKRRLG